MYYSRTLKVSGTNCTQIVHNPQDMVSQTLRRLEDVAVALQPLQLCLVCSMGPHQGLLVRLSENRESFQYICECRVSEACHPLGGLEDVSVARQPRQFSSLDCRWMQKEPQQGLCVL